MRRCTVCGEPMDSGYCIHDGEEYFCSDDCLHAYYTDEEYTEMYEDDEAYWTMWEGEDDPEQPDKLLVAGKKPGEPVQFYEIPNTVGALQGMVGGYFEIGGALAKGILILCDEEGLLKGKPYNCLGLVGELCFLRASGGDFQSLTTDDIAIIKEWEAERNE